MLEAELAPLSGAATRHLRSSMTVPTGALQHRVWGFLGDCQGYVSTEHLGEDGGHLGLESLEGSEKQQHCVAEQPPSPTPNRPDSV